MIQVGKQATYSCATFGEGEVAVKGRVLWYDLNYPKMRIPDPKVEITTKAPIVDHLSAPLGIGSACGLVKTLIRPGLRESDYKLARNLVDAISWANQEQGFVFETERT